MDQGDSKEKKDTALLMTVCEMSVCLNNLTGDAREPMINLLRSEGEAAPAEGGGPPELDLIAQFKQGFEKLDPDEARANWFMELHQELQERQPEEHKRVQYLEILYKIFVNDHPNLNVSNDSNQEGNNDMVTSDTDTYSDLDSVTDLDSDSDKENIYIYTNNILNS